MHKIVEKFIHAMTETAKVNEVEEFIHFLCRQSLLSLWSYANPLGNDGKELCDVLVVCEPDIIIFSVKEVTSSQGEDIAVDQKKWSTISAIEKAVNQICSAERSIKSATHVIRKDGTCGLPLPEPTARRIHRIVVTFGGDAKAWKFRGDFGKGFMHVFDERSLGVVMSELNTITDFIQYLCDKEEFYERKGETIFDGGGEEDLLSTYLFRNRTFPRGFILVIHDRLWEAFIRKPEYLREKEADQKSYYWDGLLETYCYQVLKDLEAGKSLTTREKIARTMARETRLDRRLLGDSLGDFMRYSESSPTDEQGASARVVSSLSGVVYVFLTRPRDYDRNLRAKELSIRCYIARGSNPKRCKTAIGMATETPVTRNGCTLDTVFFSKKAWTAKDKEKAKQLQKDLDTFEKLDIVTYSSTDLPSQGIERTKDMNQDRTTGAAANEWGRATARKIASKIGAVMKSRASNEAILDDKTVVIKCAAAKTDSVGVTLNMLGHLDSVIGAFQLDDGSFELWTLSAAKFREAMRNTRSKGAAAGKVVLVRKRSFELGGTLFKRLRLNG